MEKSPDFITFINLSKLYEEMSAQVPQAAPAGVGVPSDELVDVTDMIR